jgi:biotin-(acetyl-CoA carboxylase) ligase
MFEKKIDESSSDLSDFSFKSEIKRPEQATITRGSTFNRDLFEDTCARFKDLPFKPNLVFLPVTDSTMNAPARYQTGYGDVPFGTTFIAASQTAGTGQDGRWYTGPQDIAMTIALPDIEENKLRAIFQFSVGVAVLETLKNNAPEISDLAVKWPNDVFTKPDWQKIAGILNVSPQDKARVSLLSEKGYSLPTDLLISGIGINLGNYIKHQPGLRGTPTSVESLTGKLLSREVIAAEVACRVIEMHTKLTSGSTSLIESLSSHLLTRIGGYVEMDLNPNEHTIRGTVEGFSSVGLLFRHTNNRLDLFPFDMIKRIYPDSSIRNN